MPNKWNPFKRWPQSWKHVFDESRWADAVFCLQFQLQSIRWRYSTKQIQSKSTENEQYKRVLPHWLSLFGSWHYTERTMKLKIFQRWVTRREQDWKLTQGTSSLCIIFHFQSIRRNGWLYLWNIPRIWAVLTSSSVTVLSQATIISCLNYCNSLLIGLSAFTFVPLRVILNTEKSF